MTVLVESGYVQDFPLNHARILYDNVVEGAEASGESGAYPAGAVLTASTYERWAPALSNDTLTVTFPSQTIDAIALAAMSNLDFRLEVRTGGSFWETIIPFHFSADNQAVLVLIAPRLADGVRITALPPTADTSIGVVYVGRALTMQRPFYQGHRPAMLTAENTLQPLVSESGEWLGASLLRQGRSVSMKWQNLTAAWVRSEWVPFAFNTRKAPFFVAWNPLEHPSDILYCSSSETPAPVHSGPRDLMSVELAARGYSDGTDPARLSSTLVFF